MSYPEDDLYEKNVKYLQTVLQNPEQGQVSALIKKMAKLFATNFTDPLIMVTPTIIIENVTYDICGFHVAWLHHFSQMIAKKENGAPLRCYDVKTFMDLLAIDHKIWGVNISVVFCVLAKYRNITLLSQMFEAKNYLQVDYALMFEIFGP